MRFSTFEHYSECLRAWHAETGLMTPTLTECRRYLMALEDRDGRWAAYWATRALKSFAKFLADESGEDNALAKMKIPDMGKPKHTPTASSDDIDKLLAACSGGDIWSRRDHAIISVLRCTGMRRSEVARMRFEDVDLDTGRVLIPETKNGELRLVRLTEAAQLSLRLYLRALTKYEDYRKREGSRPELWISARRPILTSNGIQQMLVRRSEEAGVNVPAHSFRRAFAIEYLGAGGSETYLMKLAGWKHRDMVSRYTKALAVEEALKQHERLFQ